MMKPFRKMLGEKKEETTADMEMISHLYNISDKKYIEPILELLHDRAGQ